MDSIKYIQVSDLHLGGPLRGIENNPAYGPGFISSLRQSTYEALKRLVELCKQEKPDFLVIAGDSFDHDEYGIQPQLALREACVMLDQANIPVFITRGSHDPLSANIASITWPKNTIIFNDVPHTALLKSNDKPIAAIHGASFSKPEESRNLAKHFKRDHGLDCFQLGLLYCDLNAPEGSKYSSCSIDDLLAADLDAWALGHDHTLNIIKSHPFIAYSGNPQGLKIEEDGPKGCLMVTASKNEDGWQCKHEFKELNSVQWKNIDIDATGIENLQELEAKIETCLRNVIADASPCLHGLLCRLVLYGETDLNHILNKQSVREELKKHLIHFSAGVPPLWINDLVIKTSEPGPKPDYLQRDDLIGETARTSARILQSEEELIQFKQDRLAPLLTSIADWDLSDFSTEKTKDLLLRAAKICQDALENK